jgi:hypothetical protein
MMLKIVFLGFFLIGLSSCAFKDFDKDGLLGNWDACPHQAEDLDAWQDEDGCPDLDNDEDLVLDSLDECKFIPEDRDGFQDEDGCPDNNNDLDSLNDNEDKCPNLPEDYDGFLDFDGCPDYDNDRDKIVDSLDACPFEPEDKDDFEDEDGCPDTDNDKDGILDEADACPNKAGAKRVFIEGQQIGCPELTSIPRLPNVLSVPISFNSNNELSLFDKILLRDQLIQSLLEFKKQKVQLKVFVLQGNTSDEVWAESINTRSLNLKKYLESEGVLESQIRFQKVDVELLAFFEKNNESLNKVQGVEFKLLK